MEEYTGAGGKERQRSTTALFLKVQLQGKLDKNVCSLQIAFLNYRHRVNKIQQNSGCFDA